MSTLRIFIIAVAVAAVLATAGSFLVLNRAADRGPETLDKAGLIYERAERFQKSGDINKAINAFPVVFNKYPDSPYAERALRQMGAIYLKRGDHSKAKYYYERLLRTFPDISDADEVRKTLQDLNIRMMSSPAITADSVEYAVQPGDSLYAIARRHGTTVGLLKKANNLTSDMIRPGQRLKVIVSKFSILVDKSANVLILKKDGEPVKTYTVSTGKDNSTPVGVFKIEEKMVKPVWFKVGAVVSPDSEQYELGERWMGLSIEGYGIHGTNDESTIGGQVTAGCVRMYNRDVIELFDIVPSGTEVEIVDSMDRSAAPSGPAENTAGQPSM